MKKIFTLILSFALIFNIISTAAVAEEEIYSRNVVLTSVTGKVNQNNVGLGDIMLSGECLNLQGEKMMAVLALKDETDKLVNVKVKQFIPETNDEEFNVSFENLYDTVGLTAEGYLWKGDTLKPITTKAVTAPVTALKAEDLTAANGVSLTENDNIIKVAGEYFKQMNWFVPMAQYTFPETINLKAGQKLAMDFKFLGNPLNWARSMAMCLNSSSSYAAFQVSVDGVFLSGNMRQDITADKWYGVHFELNDDYRVNSSKICYKVVLYDPETNDIIDQHRYEADATNGTTPNTITSVSFSTRIPEQLAETKSVEMNLKDICLTVGNTPDPFIDKIEIDGDNITAPMGKLTPLTSTVTGRYIDNYDRMKEVRYEIIDGTGKAVMFNNSIYPIETGTISVKAVSLGDGTESEAKTVTLTDAEPFDWIGVNSAEVTTKDGITTLNKTGMASSSAYVRLAEYTLPGKLTTNSKTINMRFDFLGGTFLKDKARLVVLFNGMQGMAPLNIEANTKCPDKTTFVKDVINEDEWYSVEVVLNTERRSHNSEIGGSYKKYTTEIKDSSGKIIYSGSGVNNSSNACSNAATEATVGTPSVQPSITKVAVSTRNDSGAVYDCSMKIKNFVIGYDLYSSMNGASVTYEDGAVNVSKDYPVNSSYYYPLLWTELGAEYSTNSKAVKLSFMTKGNDVYKWARQCMIFNNAQGNPTLAILSNNGFDLCGYKTAFEDGKWYRIELILNNERKSDSEQASKKYNVSIYDDKGNELYFTTMSNIANASYVPQVIKTIDWNARSEATGGTWKMSIKDLAIKTLD